MLRTSSKTIVIVSLAALLLIATCGGGDEAKVQPASTAQEVSTPPATPAADTSAGAVLFKTKTCFTCHGADGKTALLPNYPNLAGQSVEYALQQLKDIKSGARANGQTAAMKGIMHLVSDEEMETLAHYLSTLPRRPGGLSMASDSEGAKLFKTKTCFTCHGADGKTPLLPNYPKIEGQNSAYALQQIQDIKSGIRANGQTAAMKGIMHLVSDEEMKILADYLSNLEQ